ncbi:MAG: 1-deoxy-D-xylulose-5-phosphate reductoisomerase [Pseudomonadales bacterium]|nr:1-deoxy-D-xylulose-5-phosphate reductoisomerase [Pseudomonadales bacterium]
MKQVSILGSTGSIGVSTLDVIERHPEKFSVFALSAHQQVEALYQQCLRFSPCFAVLSCGDDAAGLSAKLKAAGLETRVLSGLEGLVEIASHPQVDAVMAAIVGAAGLQPTMAAVQAGKQVLLANKEALVMAGGLMIEAAQQSGCVLLPIDSEHNAIFQCLPLEKDALLKKGISRLLLTGSGGPFRTFDLDALSEVTPEQACHHPNWEMGKKISVDSATMMNKGLELIEACWLFAMPAERIQIVIHPQSIIHSMVQYVDGSVLAQMGNPDMRTPIAHCLAWPERIESGVAELDFTQLTRLDFEPPDEGRFPALVMARAVAETGGTAPVYFNAANEIAVDAFLNGTIAFTDITTLVERVLQGMPAGQVDSLDHVLQADQEARSFALSLLPLFRSGRGAY